MGVSCNLFIADMGGILLFIICFLHVKQINSIFLPLNGEPWMIVIFPGGSMQCWSKPSFFELIVSLSSLVNSVIFVLKQHWWQHVQINIALNNVASRNLRSLSLEVFGFVILRPAAFL